MKKSLLILSMAGAIALAGCSKTEFVSAPGGTIGFRTSVATATKATDITTATLASFNAYAINHTTSVAYFEDVTFTKGDDGTFASATEYIWPEEGSLDFYAYAPVGNSQVVKTDYKTFTVTPSDNASNQVDFIYANTNEKTKAANADGVAINFRHTESQIALKVKNSSASLKFEVAGWKVAYLSKSGKFTYADASTDAASTQLAKTDWSDLGTAAVTNTYEQSLTSSVSVAESASTAAAVGESFILIPQSQTAATGYAAATTGAAANGSYIAVKLIIRNAIDNSLIYSDGADTPGAAWAMWPVDFEWEPGKKYTYVVDLAGCGFKETVDGDGDGNTDLDKTFEGTPITFVNVTVDEFAAQDDIDVTMPAEEEEASDVLDGVFSVSATKKVRFSKGNLWADNDNALHFEANQYSYSSGSTKDASHVSYFTWSSTVDAAVGDSYSGDYLFCDENHKVSVDGSNAIYYALSKDEWEYLFSNHSYKWVTVNGVNGYVIAPDGFTGTLADSYADDDALATDNLVFLPAAGRCYYGSVAYQGSRGRYWSSTPNGSDVVYPLYFNSDGQNVDVEARDLGFSVRLITDASVTPAPTPTTTGSAKATIGEADIDVNWVQLWENGPKFAEYNVGATSTTDCGGYYTWGGTYKNGIGITWSDDHNDGNVPLTGNDDTATKLWGSNWRMPTQAELQALLNTDNCTWTWTENYNGTGVNGLLCTGKGDYASNSVFLPAGGFCTASASGFGKNYSGYYFSSTPNGNYNAYGLYFDSNTQRMNESGHNYSMLVRAVLAEK